METGKLSINRDQSHKVIWIGSAKVTVTPLGRRCTVFIEAPRSTAIVRGELLADEEDFRSSQVGPYRVQVDDGYGWRHHTVHEGAPSAIQAAECVAAEGKTSRVVDCRENLVYGGECETCDGKAMVICLTCGGSGSTGPNRPDDHGPHYICSVCDGDGDTVCPTCKGVSL